MTEPKRKLDLATIADFDDQRWMVNLVILVLAGFVAAVLVTTTHDFNDPRLLFNGWVRLGSVVLLVGVLFWATVVLQSRMRRRVQLCVLLSLLFHLGLAVYLHDRYLVATAERERRQAQERLGELDDRVVVPDYHWQYVDEPATQQEFEKPVDTQPIEAVKTEPVPEQPAEPTQVVRPRIEAQDKPQPKAPDAAELRRAEWTAPHREEQAAGPQLSRRTLEHPLQANQAIPSPRLERRVAEPNAGPSPQVASVQRKAATPSRTRRQLEESARVEEPSAAPLARHSSPSQPQPEAAKAQAPERRLLQPTDLASAEIRQPRPLQAIPARPRELEAAARNAERQAALPAVVLRPEDASPARTPAAAEAVTPEARRSETAPTPAPSQTQRLARSLRRPDASLAATAVAPSALPRVDRSLQRPTPVESRSLPVARAAASPSQTLTGDRPGRELAAESSTPQIPMTVARRAAASQQEPAGSQSSPARPSTLTRSDAGIQLPSAALIGEEATAPAAAGSGAPSRLEAAASAVERASGAASLAKRTDAAGTAEFAVGTGPVVAQAGQPRAVRGSEPSVAANSPAPRLARSLDGAPAPTLARPELAEAPSVPASAGGGGPPDVNANAQATAIGPAGGVGIPPTQPVELVGAGTETSRGAAGQLGSVQLARVTGPEMLASVQAGGGVPRPSRATGRAFAADAAAEAPKAAVVTPGGGDAQGQPLDARESGQQRDVGGLPGRLLNEPAGGALAAQAERGQSVPQAAARRAPASQTEMPGDLDGGPKLGSTLARSPSGVNLPAAAASLEHEAKAGAGGVAATPGAELSGLDVGTNTSIARASAEAPLGPSTAAAGSTDLGTGPGLMVAIAGPVRAGQEALPALAADRRGQPQGRATTSAPTLSAQAQEEGLAATAPAGATAGQATGDMSQPEANGQATELARGVHGISTAQVGEVGGVPNGSLDVRLAAVAPSRLRGVGSLAVSSPVGPAGALARVGVRVPSAELPVEAGRPDASPSNTGGKGAGQGTVAAAAGSEPGGVETPVKTDLGGPVQREGGMPVEIAAVEGPGGLGQDRSLRVGIPSRRARPESEVVHALPGRFLLERSGGQWSPDGKTLEPAAAFRQRRPGLRPQIAMEHGGGEATERAVETGLDFLARHQFADGRWCLDRLPEGQAATQPEFALGQMNCDTAATGLSLLSFLGAGYTHRDDKHRDTVRRGLEWLLKNQQSNGQLFTSQTDVTLPSRIYGHGIAAIALCEAYGMTRDPELREPAQKAIRFILDAQDPQRGGWRYTQADGSPAWHKESDTSVSGWQLMALKSAQMAGLQVPEEAVAKVAGWLDAAQAQRGALYMYNPNALTTPDQIQGRSPNLAMTAEGLLMRLYLGWQRDNPAMIEGAEHLKAHLPELGTVQQPQRDSYYWYYATQVMFQMQGDYWTAWNARLRGLLEPNQVTDGPLAGSWNPAQPQRDRWAHAGGRLYVTTLNLLMLEVYYRHLPLFQTLAK
jgi:hypothetical protein